MRATHIPLVNVIRIPRLVLLIRRRHVGRPAMQLDWRERMENRLAEQLFLPTGRLPDWGCMWPYKQGIHTRYCPPSPPSFFYCRVVVTTTTEYVLRTCAALPSRLAITHRYYLTNTHRYSVDYDRWNMPMKRTNKGHHQLMAAAMAAMQETFYDLAFPHSAQL